MLRSMVSKGIRNPSKVLNYVQRNTVWKKKNQLLGVDVTKKDWDNLIILDGCRFDLFKEINTIDGELHKVRSAASTSGEYFSNNFHGGSFPDIVYITANGWYYSIDAEFHDIIPVWKTGWDPDTRTVLPPSVNECVKENMDMISNKRTVIHYMQPHMPFLTKEDGRFKTASIGTHHSSVPDTVDLDDKEIPDPWWDRLRRGELERREVWEAYKTTLEVTLPYIKEIIRLLPGKTVISADHGNAFGENGVYGHPKFRCEDVLVDVPWLEINGPRKNIVKSNQTINTTKKQKIPKEKLQDLGYLQ